MNVRSDNWAWLDDITKRWPVITCIFGLILWLTALQFKQEAMAQAIQEVPTVKAAVDRVEKKVDTLGESFDALSEALGYEIKLKAVKKKEAATP
jgi:hypothetical protein